MRQLKIKIVLETQEKFFIGFEDTTFFHLHRINKMIFHIIAEYMNKKTLSINPTQLPVLLTVFSHDGLSQQEIATLTVRDKSSIQRTLTSFHKQGLVEFLTDKTDKRKKITVTTAKGDEIATIVRKVVLQTEEKIKASFLNQEESYENYLHKIEKFADILEQSKN